MSANRNIHEPPPPPDRDSPLAFSMEGSDLLPPPSLIAHDWAPAWNSCQAINKFQIELGPALQNCVSGQRLIEPGARGTP